MGWMWNVKKEDEKRGNAEKRVTRLICFVICFALRYEDMAWHFMTRQMEE